MKYDDASWHYGGDYPEGLPEENGGIHIALFLRWCFTKGWASDHHKDEEPEETQKVADGRVSATEYFFKYCDGKLTNEDFNEEGNKFAEEYYGENGLFLEDYANKFDKLMYVAPENTIDFEIFSSMLNERQQSGVLTKNQNKPLWKLW